MQNESILTIANRYAQSISAEIKLLPERVGEMTQSNNFGGFWLHNLAAPCERLEEYFGKNLRELGRGHILGEIEMIGGGAREMQDFLHENNCQFANPKEKENFVNNLLAFNKYCQEILPILFFI